MTRPTRRPSTPRRRPGPKAAAPPAAAPPAHVPLTRARIVAAALALVERDGLAAFSLRRLGAALGCEPMSLYHYFRSKAHLLDALVDDALDGVLAQPLDGDPIGALRTMAHSYRAMAHRHPQLYPLIALHRLNTPAGVRLIDEVLALVDAAVRDERLAAQFFRVLGYYLTGAALDEASGYAKGPSAAEPVTDDYVAAHCRHLAAAAPYFKAEWWDSTFELGLESLLSAMRAAVSAAANAIVPTPKPVVRPKR